MYTELVKRSTLLVLLFHILTSGLYYIYIFFVFGDELKKETIRLNTETEVPEPFIAFIIGIFTLGIYRIYNAYQQAKALQELSVDTDYEAPSPGTVLILSFFGVGFLLNINTASNIAAYNDSNTL